VTLKHTLLLHLNRKGKGKDELRTSATNASPLCKYVMLILIYISINDM